MKSTLTILSALLAVSSAQVIVSITSPLSGTKLKAGSDAVISWVNPTVPTISQIVLAKGPANALQPVTTIATNIDTASGKYTWKIPYEVENGEYAFELGTSPNLAYAGPFSIEGGVGGTLAPSSNNTTSSSASSAPSTAPTSSAVAPAAPPISSTPAASVPGTSPSGNTSPSASASNAKAPTSSPTGTSSAAVQISSVGGKYLAAVAGVVIFASQFF